MMDLRTASREEDKEEKEESKEDGPVEVKLRPKVLHVVISLVETSAPYNEHYLPFADTGFVGICSYFPAKVSLSSSLGIWEGDGTISGFLRVLNKALDSGAYDIIHVHHVHVGVILHLNRLFGKFRNHAIVYTFHSSFPNYTWRNRLLLLINFMLVDQIVCCSHASHATLPRLYKALATGRITTVPNGVDIKRVDIKRVGRKQGNSQGGDSQSQNTASSRLESVVDNHFTIITVGRLNDTKNPMVVLNAFLSGDVTEGRLVLIGDGYLNNQITNSSQAAGLSGQVEQTGLLSRDAVYTHMHKADLLISASKVEGLPIAVMEAMACGCPVLLSDIPAHRELAQGVDFIPLVAPDDVDGFTRQIERFRAMSPEERAAIGKQCRGLVEKKFSLTTMHQKYMDVYKQVARKKARKRAV